MKKKIFISVIIIILCFLLGILISFIIGNIDKNKTQESNIPNNNDDNLLSVFNYEFNNGTKIGDNETICGMIDNVSSNIIHISDIYMLRGNMGFQVKEFNEGYINIENISSFINNVTNEEIKKESLSSEHCIVVVTGKLVNNTEEKGEKSSNYIIPNETSLNVIPTYTIYNELNQMINTNKKIEDVEIQNISSEKIYCKYLREYNINGKSYLLPHIFSIETTENTQWNGISAEDYKDKKINIYFEKPIESIEVENPIATRIENIEI